MTYFTVQDQPDLTIPEDKIVRARLVEAKVETIEYTDKKTGEPKSFDKVVWWFEVTTADHAGRKVKGETDARLSNHPANRFRAWAEALLGRELAVGTGLDLDDLIGMQVDITVRHEPDRRDPARKWERVDEVMAVVASPDQVPF